MNRIRLRLGVIALALLLSLLHHTAQSAEKRVVVLYFQDESGFDAPVGCGILSPLSRLFGKTRKQRETWNLEAGFRDMLAATLQNAPGYELVTPDELMVAYAELGLDKKSLRQKEARARLTDKLNASILVLGKIRKFKQERMKGVFQRNMAGQQQRASDVLSGGYSAAVGAAGLYYKATVAMEMVAYGLTGEEVVATLVEESENYQGGTVMSGPLEATLSDEGTTAFVGQQKIISPNRKPPVVRYEILDKVKFGVPGWDTTPTDPKIPNFRETLFGKTTQKAMDSFIAKLRDRVGPALEEVAPPPNTLVVGKIVLKPDTTEDFYVNLGISGGLKAGDRLRVFRPGEEIKDPETGEVLGSLESEVGALEVVEVLRPKLSKTRLVQGEAILNDIVKNIPAEPQTSQKTP